MMVDAPGRSLVFEGEVTVVEKKWKRNKKVCIVYSWSCLDSLHIVTSRQSVPGDV